jgi:molybdopterin-guanine dinucleotide biosynthesis protein A
MHNGISAIILSGGKGTRMNHQNKGLMNYQSRPLIRHVIERIAPQVDEIVISANRDLDAYERFGFPVAVDQSESLGPLSGILSAAKATHYSTIMIAPCDMP